MNLYLVQHAEAKPEAEDPQRSLSERGRADLMKVAAFLEAHARIEPRKIFHSGKTRARETAELLGNRLGCIGNIQVAEGLNPMDDPSIWVRRLAQAQEDMMLVGHLPHLSRLTSQLLCADENKKVVSFQMGGVVCLSRNEEALWSVRWVVVPEILS